MIKHYAHLEDDLKVNYSSSRFILMTPSSYLFFSKAGIGNSDIWWRQIADVTVFSDTLPFAMIYDRESKKVVYAGVLSPKKFKKVFAEYEILPSETFY